MGRLEGFAMSNKPALAFVALAGIRQRLIEKRIPPALRGHGITIIISGLMAMAFIGFSGMVQLQ
ncbi:MAG TPA: Rnf-Nqr domain containing protein [Thermodesulfovibrionia bacterium]|nr:Rnf-Nqr domain containing protein [Thermodesulfovibrionia bacterium]